MGEFGDFLEGAAKKAQDAAKILSAQAKGYPKTALFHHYDMKVGDGRKRSMDELVRIAEREAVLRKVEGIFRG
jgi:hypothetical protein